MVTEPNSKRSNRIAVIQEILSHPLLEVTTTMAVTEMMAVMVVVATMAVTTLVMTTAMEKMATYNRQACQHMAPPLKELGLE